jgi:hypothetical protein
MLDDIFAAIMSHRTAQRLTSVSEVSEKSQKNDGLAELIFSNLEFGGMEVYNNEGALQTCRA